MQESEDMFVLRAQLAHVHRILKKNNLEANEVISISSDSSHHSKGEHKELSESVMQRNVKKEKNGDHELMSNVLSTGCVGHDVSSMRGEQVRVSTIMGEKSTILDVFPEGSGPPLSLPLFVEKLGSDYSASQVNNSQTLSSQQFSQRVLYSDRDEAMTIADMSPYPSQDQSHKNTLLVDEDIVFVTMVKDVGEEQTIQNDTMVKDVGEEATIQNDLPYSSQHESDNRTVLVQEQPLKLIDEHETIKDISKDSNFVHMRTNPKFSKASKTPKYLLKLVSNILFQCLNI